MSATKRQITHFFKGIGVSIGGLTPFATSAGTFRRIHVYEHAELGRVFVLGNEIQHVEAWAPLYHEPLVHLAASFVKTVRHVLILGGGTLFAASEVLKYKSVKRVVIVDHDPEVVAVSARVYSHAKNCLADSRCIIINEDAYSFLLNDDKRYDLIINDGSDLLDAQRGIHRADPDLFRIMMSLLRPAGVCADVVFRHVFESGRTVQTIRSFSKNKIRFALSLVFLPEYHGVLHTMTIWGGRNSLVTQNPKGLTNLEQIEWARRPTSCPCIYYDPRFLGYYLYLPRYIRAPLRIKKTVV